MKVGIEVSARHVHLSRQAVDVLFGAGYQLTAKKDLSQPGQFACEERVTINGPKESIKNVIVIGPVREKTQVEISLTDCRKLGIAGVIRESGDLAGTPGCEISGPNGTFVMKEGLIVVKRHIHMTPEIARKIGAKNGQIVQVEIENTGRAIIFSDVILRVSENFEFFMHIDTDEGNAINYNLGTVGKIIL